MQRLTITENGETIIDYPIANCSIQINQGVSKHPDAPPDVQLYMTELLPATITITATITGTYHGRFEFEDNER